MKCLEQATDLCDWFSLCKQLLSNGNRVCYTYRLRKESSDSICVDIDYYVINSDSGLLCGIVSNDLSGLIKSTSNDNWVTVPHQGNTDNTNVNGIKIDPSKKDDIYRDFEICFDSSIVSGIQSNGLIGLKIKMVLVIIVRSDTKYIF